MWVLIDNYDSFTYILHHYLLQTGHDCRVIRNDAISIPDLAALKPRRLIISPGPQTPLQAGITMEAIRHFREQIPILGICLGHQALGMFFDAPLVHTPVPVHGKSSRVQHSGHELFAGVPPVFEVMRYHSLAVDLAGNPQLDTIAVATEDQVAMACTHKYLPLTGIQFHPESIGTASGQRILDNWARLLADRD